MAPLHFLCGCRSGFFPIDQRGAPWIDSWGSKAGDFARKPCWLLYPPNNRKCRRDIKVGGGCVQKGFWMEEDLGGPPVMSVSGRMPPPTISSPPYIIYCHLPSYDTRLLWPVHTLPLWAGGGILSMTVKPGGETSALLTSVLLPIFGCVSPQRAHIPLPQNAQTAWETHSEGIFQPTSMSKSKRTTQGLGHNLL